MNKDPERFLVCGGASKAGLDTALQLRDLGYDCLIAGREQLTHNETRQQKLNMKDRITFYNVDFAQPESVGAFCQELENFKHPIHGVLFFQRSRSVSMEEGFQVSISASHQIIEQVKGELIKHQGSITFIVSILGKLIDPEQTLSYHLEKSALETLMKYHAVKEAHHGLKINALSLSTLQHSVNEPAYQPGGKVYPIVKELVPSQTPATVTDIVNTTLFLHKQAKPVITGQVIPIDGGLSLLSQVSSYLHHPGDE